jgi:predicted nucleotidyltransferase/DNA-binding transcriptional ArsR family regulator
MTTKSIQPNKTLKALFTSQARVEVLKVLLLNPAGRHYLREIATLTRQPVRAIQRELARLEEAGLVQGSREGNRTYFRANRESPVFPELKALFMKTAGLGALIQKSLLDGPGTIRVAFLFGSYARGEEGPTSDVDLLVVGDITGRSLARLLGPARLNLGREINPVVLSVSELRTRNSKKDGFVNRILREPKMFLIGGEDELTELIGAGPAAAA